MQLSWSDGGDFPCNYSDISGGEDECKFNFKIAAVGILVSVLSQVLKHSGREEQAFLTSFAGLFTRVVLDCSLYL